MWRGPIFRRCSSSGKWSRLIRKGDFVDRLLGPHLALGVSARYGSPPPATGDIPENICSPQVLLTVTQQPQSVQREKMNEVDEEPLSSWPNTI
jgi:hypothetical protein